MKSLIALLAFAAMPAFAGDLSKLGLADPEVTRPAAASGNWTGFWLFVAAMAVIAGAVAAARPMLLAPIARLFGDVQSR